MVEQQEEKASDDLDRTLGLNAALAIGVGTMVGAGIFVFPGIAAGYAGPAAMISFALGGSIALLVASSTAELATAMPESGGAYYYVSRTFGALAGFVIGISQWIGLVFASAFYLSGFGQYAIGLLHEAGYQLGDPVILIASGSALFLTVVNLLGTEEAGKLQNRVVIILTFLLSLLFGFGVLNAVGVVGEVQCPLPFAPKGTWPIFTTTALIFTSYLGFVQIATVAGEIKEPKKNLPRALLGSVFIVMTLYIMALFVSTSVLSPDRLAELGETAMVKVANSLVGQSGALIILFAGLLATLSSANASILSSSRAIYALSYDDLLPSTISKVNDRFGTPHLALLAVGLPIAGLTMLGRIEILAEVASLLHLIMYGMICVTLMTLRRRNPQWYDPAYKVRGGFFIAAGGAIASFGLIFLMEYLSIVLGFGVLCIALGWYVFFVPEKEFLPPLPSIIKPELFSPRVLVPVELPNPSSISTALLDAFYDLELLVLGYRIVPEQTSPEQSRGEFKAKADEELNEIVKEVQAQGINVEKNIIFTPDLAQSMKRYINDKNCHSILTAKPIESVERLLVPIYAKSQVNSNLATILYDLALSVNLPISLIILTSGEKESEEQSKIKELEEFAIHFLKEAGFEDEQIRSNRTEVTNVAKAVEQLSAGDDVIVLSEARTTDRDSFFNTLHEKIEEAIECPVLVVLGDRDQDA